MSALCSLNSIGALCRHLKSELINPFWSERFALILEEYLAHCGRFSADLRKQNQAVVKMQRVAELIAKLKREHSVADEDAMAQLRKELHKLNDEFFGPVGKFQIPYDPKLEATTLIVEKCRFMSSKMVPLWLVFKNSDEDAPPIYMMFKASVALRVCIAAINTCRAALQAGDDLRQDILSLQILTVMDKLWLGAKLDLKMKPYRVLATGSTDSGDGCGLVQVVMNSDTTSNIQIQYGALRRVCVLCALLNRFALLRWRSWRCVQAGANRALPARPQKG